MYAISSGIKTANREGYSLVEMTKDRVYKDSDFTFKKSDGFAVAAAVWYGDEKVNEKMDDPEIGQIKFVIKYWEDST